MKKRKFLVKSIARNVRVMNEDLRKNYIINPCAERELSTLERKVSPQLYGIHNVKSLIYAAKNIIIYTHVLLLTPSLIRVKKTVYRNPSQETPVTVKYPPSSDRK